ncbi:MAG: hypothetical protein P4L53_22625 [Candidatus Obscuribacterales bacterium]|nr:hypothetical protein [Candidatus Obscuribacterales bacterium]
MTTAERNTAPEKTEKTVASRPEAQPAHFDTPALLAQHKDVVGDAKTKSTATLEKPDTANLYGKPEAAGAKKPDAPAGVEVADASKKSVEASDKTPGNGNAKGEVPLPETKHTVAPGETMDQIAQEKLGKNASKDDIARYSNATLIANGIQSFDPKEGTKLVLPGRASNGDFVYNNPENKNEHVAVHKDGTVDAKNSKDGTSYHQEPLDDNSNSYIREHHGPKAADNYKEAYFDKDRYTFRESKDKDGTIHDVGSDGSKRTKDKSGNWKAEYGPSSPKKDESFDAKTQVTTTHNKDGSTITNTKGSPEFTVVDKEGTTTVTNVESGTQTVDRKDAEGHDISTKKVQSKDGSYTLDGTGVKPADKFHETYDAKTGQTVRTEGIGTPEEKTTTHEPDGTIKVEAKDGNNYQRNPDGSERHWGNKTFDKPPYDYKNDAAMNQERTDLDKSIKENIPDKQQLDFKKDMAAFEDRAQKEHLPPEEITKTYAQMNKLLNAKDSESVIPAENRALLAEQLMHQVAHPGQTSQGLHETCNVTTVAKETLTKAPSKMAEVATSTALTGHFTAPDGKEIKVDKKSLEPGGEEQNVKPHDGERSYATQVLNVALANEALQGRNPPESYAQRTPDPTVPGDTGERRMDASGKVMNGTMARRDSEGNIRWLNGPLNDPGLTAHEISSLGKAYNGDSNHVIDPTNIESGTEMVTSSQQLGQRLQQYKDQKQLPVSISVDSNHPPIADKEDVAPGYGGHIVNITDYDAQTGKVMVSNNWDTEHNHWVNLKDLYNNSSGLQARQNDGTDITWPDELTKEK